MKTGNTAECRAVELLQDWGREFWHFFKHFCKWLWKSIQYSIFLWNDYDWDYGHILLLMEYKLRRTRKCIGNSKVLMKDDASTIAKDIFLAEHYIQQILEDEHCKQEWAKHDKKWGPLTFSKTIEKGKEQTVMSRPNVHTREGQEQETKESKKIYDLEFHRQEKMWSALFEHLKKNMRNWWD